MMLLYLSNNKIIVNSMVIIVTLVTLTFFVYNIKKVLHHCMGTFLDYYALFDNVKVVLYQYGFSNFSQQLLVLIKVLFSEFRNLKDRFNCEYLILRFSYPSHFAGTNNYGIEQNQPHPLIGGEPERAPHLIVHRKFVCPCVQFG